MNLKLTLTVGRTGLRRNGLNGMLLERRRWRSNHSTGSSHDDENSHEPDAIKWEQFDFGDVQLLPPEILDWIVLRKVAFQLLHVFQCSVPSTTSWT